MRDSAVIGTERLILRPHETTDFDDVYGLWSDRDVIQHIFDRAQTEAEAWARLLRYRGHWDLLGFGYWAVVEKTSGRFMGEVGFADYKRDTKPSYHGIPEAGWVMAPHSHGRGMAREAMEAALAWCDANLRAEMIWAMTVRENISSLRLANRLGFAEARVGTHAGSPVVLLERHRP